MSSPFPGMDPYLERHWGDVHHRLVNYACDQIQAALPIGLRARMEERVFVESPSVKNRPLYPDIRVVERGLVVRWDSDPTTEGFIEIIDIQTGRHVVSVIEFLSPANKLPGEGRRLYRKKQRECRKGRVNLVEIDLVRRGKCILMIGEENIPADWRTVYQVCVNRAEPNPEHLIYRVPLRTRLPVIRIPLRPKDKDVHLDLQPVFEQTYLQGAYDGDIDYEGEPDPPLDPDNAKWADALLREKGLRKAKRPRQGGRNGKRRKAD